MEIRRGKRQTAEGKTALTYSILGMCENMHPKSTQQLCNPNDVLTKWNQHLVLEIIQLWNDVRVMVAWGSIRG